MTIGANLEQLFSLEGKVILLTGATGGIGSVLAKGLASTGATMVLADLEQSALDQLCLELDGSGHSGYELDISQVSRLEDFAGSIAEKHGKIDVLINCAGINKREGLLDVEEKTYDKIMDVNLKGLFFLSQAVVRKSMIRTGGKIINLASFTSTSTLGGVSVYGATKSGVAALTRSMAIEWAKYNIQANAIAPGHILTALTQVTWDHKERAAYLRERIAAERPGLPEELVSLTILLASNSSDYITGALINVDGGALAGGKPWPFDTQY